MAKAINQVSRRENVSMAKKVTKAPAKKAATKPVIADWRSETLDRVRALIKDADPQVIEEQKWKKPSRPAGVPTWSRDGIICTGETYKDKVKFTFARGAALADPAKLFNASLDAGTRRAIDIREGDTLNGKAFLTLIRGAVALNAAKKKLEA